MKEPARTIHKGLCFNKEFHPKSQIAAGSFKTIPKSLKQLPVKNLIIHEAPLRSICFKALNFYKINKSRNLIRMEIHLWTTADH
jgi:hypothetical protein